MVKIELYFDWEEDAPRYLNCLPFLGQGIEVREMGGFFMSVSLRLRHGRSTRGARAEMFERGSATNLSPGFLAFPPRL